MSGNKLAITPRSNSCWLTPDNALIVHMWSTSRPVSVTRLVGSNPSCEVAVNWWYGD